MAKSPKKCVFLDRDGVLNQDHGYTYKVEDLLIIPGVIEGLVKLSAAGYCLVVLTNQSGVARGLFTLADVDQFNRELLLRLKQSVAHLNLLGFMVCPHHPGGSVAEYSVVCECRKPGIKLINDAVEQFGIDMSKSWLVGDKSSDIDCALKAGIRGIQVTEGGQKYQLHNSPFAVAKNLKEAADIILLNS